MGRVTIFTRLDTKRSADPETARLLMDLERSVSTEAPQSVRILYLATIAFSVDQ
jgi:hypothetical protein